jgi:hypothetical protein
LRWELERAVYTNISSTAGSCHALIGQMAGDVGIVGVCWDGVALPYRDRAFGWVVLYSVLLHVPEDDIRKFIKECARVSGNYVFISTYSGTKTGLAPHCFAHNYEELFADAGLLAIKRRAFLDRHQAQWVLMVQ